MSSDAVAGALSPLQATQDLYNVGLHHLTESSQLAFIKNVAGGLLLSFGGLVSRIASAGSPQLEQSNPGLVRLLEGLFFPIGLVAIYFVGAELYTGYPMWLTMTALERKGKPLQYVRAMITPWLGNLAGALFAAYFFTYLTEALSEEPYRTGVVNTVNKTIVDKQWHVIFLRAIACGYMVTTAMFFGSQNKDGISKALGLHLPFFLSIAAEFPHTVEYMYTGAISMMLGADLSVWKFIWKCLLPITLGNAIGGAVFTGLYNWWVYLYCKDGERTKDWFADFPGAMGADGNREGRA